MRILHFRWYAIEIHRMVYICFMLRIEKTVAYAKRFMFFRESPFKSMELCKTKKKGICVPNSSIICLFWWSKRNVLSLDIECYLLNELLAPQRNKTEKMVYSMDFVGFVTDCRKTNPFGVVKIQMPKNKHIDFFCGDSKTLWMLIHLLLNPFISYPFAWYKFLFFFFSNFAFFIEARSLWMGRCFNGFLFCNSKLRSKNNMTMLRSYDD